MTLADYVITSLGDMATHLEWTSSSDEVDLIIDDTLLALGLATEGASTDEVALKAVARYIAWVNVANSISTLYDVQADRATFQRSGTFQNVRDMIALHKQAALPYLLNSQIVIGEITEKEDPYTELTTAEFG